MALTLEPMAHLPDEFRRVALERLDIALDHLAGMDGMGPAEIEDAVHDVRKRCKEVRAIARLVRKPLGGEFSSFNGLVRSAAKELSSIRDSHAVLATFDDLRFVGSGDDDEDLDAIRTVQAADASAATQGISGGDPRILFAHSLLVDARRHIELWELPDDPAILADGIRRTYVRGQKTLRRARNKPTDDRMHEFRKPVKTLWYQVRLLEEAAPSVLTPFIAQLDDLAEALGDDHDLSVLVARLKKSPVKFGGKKRVKPAIRIARTQQADLRRRAFRLATTLYAETPDAFGRRLGHYWNATLKEGPELATGGIAELVAEEQHRADGSTSDSSTESADRLLERERKYLVTCAPQSVTDGSTLRQGYLAIDGNVSVRVRDSGDRGCTLTLKAGRGAVRTELEWPISVEQFDAVWAQTEGRRVHKTRYEFEEGGHVILLDVFADELSGLVMAEVEFDSDEAMAGFEAPGWFGPEVTDDPAYTNASLAVHGVRIATPWTERSTAD